MEYNEHDFKVQTFIFNLRVFTSKFGEQCSYGAFKWGNVYHISPYEHPFLWHSSFAVSLAFISFEVFADIFRNGGGHGSTWQFLVYGKVNIL